MTENEIPDVLHKYMKENITVTDARFGLRCETCGHTWGVGLDPAANLTMQAQKLICLPCMQKEINKKRTDKEGNNEYSYTKQFEK